MQNPQRDISLVLTTLTTSRNPADLRAAVNKFYTHDASLHHPFRIVEHGKNSRQKILAMYEWYRIISPDTTSNVNAEKSCYFCRGNPALSYSNQPLKVAPSRYTIRIQLQERDKVFYIYSQEEFLHPMDWMNSVLPPLTPLVRFALVFFAFMGVMCSKIWVFSLLLWAKLFGIGSDIQRGQVKWA
ncbi:hypothetical protein BDR07DRAFT_1487292 [Suillus spraguei]|nr:hypothetical protein BDR07DRAFT_1487292 [Suillus spraguei]